MEITDLKKVFFGYSKNSVYQYIVTLNDEFSKKIVEKEEKNEELLNHLRKKNEMLEQELKQVRMENEAYRKQYFAISDSLIDAQNYAAKLKEETKQQEEQLRKKMNDEMESQNEKLKLHRQEIEQLRANVRMILERMDQELSKSQEQAEEIVENSFNGEEKQVEIIEPIERKNIGNMSLFQRREKIKS